QAPMITMTYKEAGSKRVAQRIEAEGPVYVVGPEQSIKGDHAVYEAAQSLIVVTGNVVMRRGQDVGTCDRLDYNQATGRITMSMASPQKRVRTVLHFAEETPAAK